MLKDTTYLELDTTSLLTLSSHSLFSLFSLTLSMRDSLFSFSLVTQFSPSTTNKNRMDLKANEQQMLLLMALLYMACLAGCECNVLCNLIELFCYLILAYTFFPSRRGAVAKFKPRGWIGVVALIWLGTIVIASLNPVHAVSDSPQ